MRRWIIKLAGIYLILLVFLGPGDKFLSGEIGELPGEFEIGFISDDENILAKEIVWYPVEWRSRELQGVGVLVLLTNEGDQDVRLSDVRLLMHRSDGTVERGYGVTSFRFQPVLLNAHSQHSVFAGVVFFPDEDASNNFLHGEVRVSTDEPSDFFLCSLQQHKFVVDSEDFLDNGSLKLSGHITSSLETLNTHDLVFISFFGPEGEFIGSDIAHIDYQTGRFEETFQPSGGQVQLKTGVHVLEAGLYIGNSIGNYHIDAAQSYGWGYCPLPIP